MTHSRTTFTTDGAGTGPAGGDLSGNYPDPAVAAITTTTGPTSLTIGAVGDGQRLQRSGATIIGVADGGGDVVGPGPTVTDEALVRFNGTGGLTIEEGTWQNTGNNLVPPGVGTGFVGLSNTPFAGLNSERALIANYSAASKTFDRSLIATFSGTSQSYITVTANGKGAAFIGQADSSNNSAVNINATSFGSVIMGSFFGDNGYTCTADSTNFGTFVAGLGYAYYGTSTHQAAGRGSFCQGYVQAQAGTAALRVSSPGAGGFTQGFATVSSASTGGNAYIRVNGPGNFAQGRVLSVSGGSTAYIFTSGAGSFGQGYCTGSAGYNARILAQADGSMATGAVVAATASSVISCSGTAKGSFAHAYVANGQSCLAQAVNAMQFGAGTNAETNSLQMGGGVRIFGTTNGQPGTPKNGDIYVYNSYVYIRSNGTGVKIV